MSKSLKVLFLSVQGAGHMNACISLGQQLLSAGHRVIFAATAMWEKTLKDNGFEVELYIDEARAKMGDNPGKHFANITSKLINKVPPLEKVKDGDWEMGFLMDNSIKFAERVQPLIDSVKPDVMVLDQFMTLPPVVNSGIPWVWSWSANPLYMYGNDDDVPTFRLGEFLLHGDACDIYITKY